jgi:hypothetical protein
MNFFLFLILGASIITIGYAMSNKPGPFIIISLMGLFAFIWLIGGPSNLDFTFLFNATPYETINTTLEKNITIPIIDDSIPNYMGNITIDTRWDSGI